MEDDEDEDPNYHFHGKNELLANISEVGIFIYKCPNEEITLSTPLNFKTPYFTLINEQFVNISEVGIFIFKRSRVENNMPLPPPSISKNRFKFKAQLGLLSPDLNTNIRDYIFAILSKPGENLVHIQSSFLKVCQFWKNALLVLCV